MTPYWSDDHLTLYGGDCRDVLRELPAESVHCVVTSPPYWGLRDYGTATWDGGGYECAGRHDRIKADPDWWRKSSDDIRAELEAEAAEPSDPDRCPICSAPRCDHDVRRWEGPKQTQGAQSGHASEADRLARTSCPCGARRIDSQLGLEPTPEEYVANMVAVFREVRRVLRKDGTLWLNLGDSYAGTLERGESYSSGVKRKWQHGSSRDTADEDWTEKGRVRTGLKPKDLCGIPWMVAFALRADGWYLRSDVIWAKPNPMPESVTDRPTKAHEYLFLLSKSPRYYYDAEAVRERDGGATATPRSKQARVLVPGKVTSQYGLDEGWEPGGGRNLRSVWTIATEPYPGAHFATFPRKLVEPCVKAGTSERGVCPECGAGWVREVVSVIGRSHDGPKTAAAAAARGGRGRTSTVGQSGGGRVSGHTTTTGWRAACAHDAEPVPAVVLDPFAGSGTTLLVAQALGRRGIGIDLSPDYLRQALGRNAQTPLGLIG